jgi:1-acyl-sn-glycerol-3-phosphate acyltransferase
MTANDPEWGGVRSTSRSPVVVSDVLRLGLRPQPRSGSTGASRVVQTAELMPTISQMLLRLFTWYSRRYLRRHFHSLRVSLMGLPPANLNRPTVIYSNHASWWDPLVGLVLRQEFLARQKLFAPMDATALERYGFFKRLGAFGVEQGTRRGAARFLRTAQRILQQEDSVLWLTPQSRFADARERPVRFKQGIGHLPGYAKGVCFIPVAIEYVFWEERLPEILVRFGKPHEASASDDVASSQKWTEFFAGQLAQTQDALAAEAQRREPGMFRCLLRGSAGVGGVYDRWRAFKAGLRGEKFQPEHGKL